MVVNGKIALNPYTTDITYMDLVSIGDKVVANESVEEYQFTTGRNYEILSHDGHDIKVMDDNGDEVWVSVDYFHSKVIGF